jgi:hypothetical protein
MGVNRKQYRVKRHSCALCKPNKVELGTAIQGEGATPGEDPSPRNDRSARVESRQVPP